MAKYLQNMAQQAYRDGSAVTSQRRFSSDVTARPTACCPKRCWPAFGKRVIADILHNNWLCSRFADHCNDGVLQTLTFAVKPLVCKIYSRQTKISNTGLDISTN